MNAFAQYAHKYEVKGNEVGIDIKKLMRGDDWQEQFIVSSFDTALIQDIRSSLEIVDKWERQYALKRLRRRIAENSVNVRFEKWMPTRPDDFDDDDYNEGYGEVTDIIEDKIYLIYEFDDEKTGPIKITKEIAGLLKKGDTVNLVVVRKGKLWYPIEVGNVYSG